jgi:hypothetical protein
MADFPTIPNVNNYYCENQIVCSVSDKFEKLIWLNTIHLMIEFLDVWLVASSRNKRRPLQAGQEHCFWSETDHVLLFELINCRAGQVNLTPPTLSPTGWSHFGKSIRLSKNSGGPSVSLHMRRRVLQREGMDRAIGRSTPLSSLRFQRDRAERRQGDRRIA